MKRKWKEYVKAIPCWWQTVYGLSEICTLRYKTCALPSASCKLQWHLTYELYMSILTQWSQYWVKSLFSKSVEIMSNIDFKSLGYKEEKRKNMKDIRDLETFTRLLRLRSPSLSDDRTQHTPKEGHVMENTFYPVDPWRV